MIIYGLGTCDTCRKARKALPDAEFVDVRSNGLPAEVLDEAFKTFGEKLLNTKSKTWRELNEAQKQGTVSELITAHPLLMKRPLIQRAERFHLGWTKDVQSDLGL